MKKILIVLAVLLVAGYGFSVCGLSFADWTHGWDSDYDYYHSKGKTEDDEKMESICPITRMDDDCLTCHMKPTFELKEVDPVARYDSIPGCGSRVIIRNGKKYPYFKLESIVSEPVKSFFDYVSWHNELEKHIIFEVHSPGGSLMEAWRIVGILEHWKARGYIVETRVHGFAASAGFILFANGTKGYRFASPQAELMWHELYTFDFFKVSTPSGTKDEAEVLDHLQTTASTYLSERSNLSVAEWNEKVHKKEFWCNGKQAVEIGLSDGEPK